MRLNNTLHHSIAILLGMLCGIGNSSVLDQKNHPDHFLVTATDEWRYQTGTDTAEPNWRNPEFEDARWKSGKAGFGYGDDDDRTHLKSMRGRYTSVQIRRSFIVASPDAIADLFLYVLFDDAFIAYLNGLEIARSGVSERNGKRIIEEHEADDFDVFSITNPSRLFREGINVLAVEGFNRSIKSSDFSLHPVLTTQPIQNPGLPVSITRDEMLSDLNNLEQRLEDQSSYLLLNKFDFRKTFDQLRSDLDQHSTPLLFARKLQKTIALIGDAHAEVKLDLDTENDRYLPFVLADSADGIVAINADRKTFLEDEYPFIESIDGKSIEHWLDIAGRFVAQASPQLIRRESLLELRSVDRMRTEDGAARSSFVEITLRSPDGSRIIERRLNTSKKRKPVGKLFLSDSKILEDNIGYLRIRSMNKSRAKNVLSNMTNFRDTDGLIIDVRGNRGGYYEILQALYGYFIAENAPPYVSNIAAYRRSSRFDYDHLHYRPTYRLRYSGWTAAEKKAIKKAIANFKPEWRFPKGKFSAWHYMVLGKSGDTRQYHYQKPVVVLSNAASYSATDGFLSAFSNLPGVVLIGQPSSGASGATQQFTLQNSGIRIALSSMASFRPNGKLFDGNGIEVDIPIKPAPRDFLGRSDVVLDRAKEWIKQATEQSY